MKSKRSWPGVPNRYSTSSRSMVMRPKSIATVVSFLRDRVLVGDAALGREHGDLADRADQRGLAGRERTGDDDLDGLTTVPTTLLGCHVRAPARRR